MIHASCNFFSRVLKNHVGVEVLLPAMFDNDALFCDLDEIYLPRRFPVLYLLHGALEDETSWLRMTGIERYAQRRQLAVVMPRGQNGFYVNARYGLDYLDFLGDELPRMIAYTFPGCLGGERYVAGCSMGGYGAARLALGRPGQYRAFGCLSGAVDPPRLEPMMTAMGFDFFRYDLLFGGVDRLPGTDDDLWRLAADYPGDKPRPKALFYCGAQDENNLNMNRDLVRHLEASGFKTRFSETEGAHDWAFWDRAIASFLDDIMD